MEGLDQQEAKFLVGLRHCIAFIFTFFEGL